MVLSVFILEIDSHVFWRAANQLVLLWHASLPIDQW